MTLFAEISATSPRASRSDRRDDVRASLARLCCTRRGSLLLAPDYGADDATHLFHSFPGGLEEWRSHLENAIRMYEPRLRAVRVVPRTNDPLDLTLRFDIHGVLTSDPTAAPIRFMAAVDPSQGWSVG
jgi:type VI secretion system protein